MAKENHNGNLLSALTGGSNNSKLASTLTKREWMATMCLQGILSNKSIHKSTVWSAVQSAIMYADQMLESLHDETEQTQRPYVQPGSFQPGLSPRVAPS